MGKGISLKHFAIGNTKLSRSVLIFNITSATNCPSKKKGLCKVCKFCYAKKAERLYKEVLPFRERQTMYWDESYSWDIAGEIRRIVSKRPYIKFLRLNEAGDFRDQSDVTKADSVATILKRIGIKTYCYTARKDLDFSDVSFIVRGSGWDAKNGRTEVITKDQKPEKGFKVCPAHGCMSDCNLCSKTKGNIAFRKH